MNFDIPLIPAAIVSTIAVFAIFNVNNPIDLTDSGIAKAKTLKRAERIAKGLPKRSTEGIQINVIQIN
jgi:hypothetical protein